MTPPLTESRATRGGTPEQQQQGEGWTKKSGASLPNQQQEPGPSRDATVRPSCATFQPYYVAYAAAHGMTPEQMAARTDRLRNVDFMIWMRRQWQAFRAVRPDLFAPRPFDSEPQKVPGCHEAFGVWLAGGAA